MKQENTTDMVSEHKANLLLSGNLSDFQVKNLKSWPYIVFDLDKLENVEIKYNFKLNEESEQSNALGVYAGEVIFNFKFKKRIKIKQSEKEKALSDLTLWTKFLFWNDTEVKFKRNGKPWK